MGRPLGENPARYRTGFALHIYLFAALTDAAREVWLSRWCRSARQLVNPSGFNGSLKSLVKRNLLQLDQM
jgi:hypothetical protein